MIKLSTPLIELKGVGPAFALRFKKLGIETVRDLLWHFPFRYEDFSKISKIVDVRPGGSATVQGMIASIKMHRTWKRRMFIIEAVISDDTGSIKAIWFNQRFLLSVLKKGTLVNLAGRIIADPKSGIALSHPMYEILGRGLPQIKTQIDADDIDDYQPESAFRSAIISETRHTARLVPVYPETKGVTSKMIRYLMKPILDDLEKIAEPIPRTILHALGFPDANDAIYQIHFPEKITEARLAKKRFAFEDLFFLQLANLRQRLKLAHESAHAVRADIEYIKALLAELPFALTQSQKVALWEILKDIAKPHPMNRLLQGDVGSGKTIVAALAALLAARQGRQSAFMAPTEILARQHYETFKKFFKEFDKGVALITSAEARVFFGDGLETESDKHDVARSLYEGRIKIVVGTHALIQKDIYFEELAFVVIDEQHRFGVEQRAQLFKQKETKMRSESLFASPKRTAGFMIPHLLSMSATPIPRTLSLTLFGDLDLSIITELPQGRKNIITKVVAPKDRNKAYDFIREQVKAGRQAFVICPRIDPSEESGEDSEIKPSPAKLMLWEVRNVKEEFEKLSKKIFPDLNVGMLHGKLPAKGGSASGGKSKAEIMDAFKKGEIDILVSTSVIEVGVDVSNATIMMIEGADRFGLAQLYQFRGRVGRGEHQSFCLLFTDAGGESTKKRLHSLVEAKNGFELAEKDLEIRGPGQFLGGPNSWAQTGMPDLAMKAMQNPELVKEARGVAEKVLGEDPELTKYPLLRERLEKFEKKIHLE